MHTSNSRPGPQSAYCDCGRERAAAAASSYRSESGRFVFYRCRCGAEWTERSEPLDRSQPVSGDEVLEVHQRLSSFEGSLRELLSRS